MDKSGSRYCILFCCLILATFVHGGGKNETLCYYKKLAHFLIVKYKSNICCAIPDFLSCALKG